MLSAVQRAIAIDQLLQGHLAGVPSGARGHAQRIEAIQVAACGQAFWRAQWIAAEARSRVASGQRVQQSDDLAASVQGGVGAVRGIEQVALRGGRVGGQRLVVVQVPLQPAAPGLVGKCAVVGGGARVLFVQL